MICMSAGNMIHATDISRLHFKYQDVPITTPPMDPMAFKGPIGP